MIGVHRDTVMRLLVRVGESCVHFLDKHVRNVSAQKVQVDEIWTYVFKKQAKISLSDAQDAKSLAMKTNQEFFDKLRKEIEKLT